uniref:Coiled-coil domain-containing protein 153 n=1 Tax=Parascaris univalens TaxID=6257 RepID=A0A914ZTG9_PARUN
MLKREQWTDELYKVKLGLDVAQNELFALHAARDTKICIVVLVHSFSMGRHDRCDASVHSHIARVGIGCKQSVFHSQGTLLDAVELIAHKKFSGSYYTC